MRSVSPGRANAWVSLAAVVTGFAIPVSTALENTGAFALLVASLLAPFRPHWPDALRQPFVRACLLLWTLTLIGLSYAPDSPAGLDMLWQLHPLLAAPAFFAVCRDHGARNSLIAGFAAGALASLLASLLSWAAGMPLMAGEADRLMNGLAIGEHHNWVVFRDHIFHTLFLAWLAIGALAVLLAGRITPRRRLFVAVMLAFTLFGLFFIVRGRTGQVLFLVLLPLALWLWDKRRGLLIGALALGVGVPVLWHSSDALRERLQQAGREASQIGTSSPPTSIGLRLIWYRDSIAAIADSPLIGHGTGSSRGELTRRQAGNAHELVRTRNPHSSYLWLGIELGLIGVAALVAIFASSLARARQFETPQSWLIILITWSMILGNLVNSFVMDRPTGTGYILIMCALLAGPLHLSGTVRQSDPRPQV